jgi:hypothetical protein
MMLCTVTIRLVCNKRKIMMKEFVASTKDIYLISSLRLSEDIAGKQSIMKRLSCSVRVCRTTNTTTLSDSSALPPCQSDHGWCSVGECFVYNYKKVVVLLPFAGFVS